MLARCQQYQHIKGVHQLSLDHSSQQHTTTILQLHLVVRVGALIQQKSKVGSGVCVPNKRNQWANWTLRTLWDWNESWMNNHNNITLLFVCSQKICIWFPFFSGEMLIGSHIPNPQFLHDFRWKFCLQPICWEPSCFGRLQNLVWCCQDVILECPDGEYDMCLVSKYQACKLRSHTVQYIKHGICVLIVFGTINISQ